MVGTVQKKYVNVQLNSHGDDMMHKSMWLSDSCLGIAVTFKVEGDSPPKEISITVTIDCMDKIVIKSNMLDKTNSVSTHGPATFMQEGWRIISNDIIVDDSIRMVLMSVFFVLDLQ